MTETGEAIKIHRGLRGVYFDRSPCTFIDGKAGELRYRGYSIHDLAEHSSFEETAWLLLNGDLPSKQQLAAFDAELKSARGNCLRPSSISSGRSSPHIRWMYCAQPRRRYRRSIRKRLIIRARRHCAKPSG